MESFEQLRRNMMWIFENRKDIPQEVTTQIQNMFNNLEEKYKEMGCYNSSIEQYMQGSIEELVARLERGVGTRRKDGQYDDIQAFLSGVQRDLEQNLDDQEQRRKDAQRQGQISEIGNNGPNNIGITLNSMDQIVEVLKDVQSRQNRILSARGFGDREIDIMNQEVQAFIMHLRSRNEDGIHEAFMQDNADLRRELMQAYEQYIAEREGEKSSEQKTEQSEYGDEQKLEQSSNQISFKESLYAGISLEQQSANAIAFRESAEQEEANRQTTRQSLADMFK